MTSEEYSNYDYVINLLSQNKNVLQFASNTLKNNYNIVWTSIIKFPLSLEFASDKLRDNFEIVSEAVKICSISFNFASNRLKNDKRIICKCINDGRIFNYLSDDLKYDYKLIKLYISITNSLPLHIFNNDFLNLLKSPYPKKYYDNNYYINYRKLNSFSRYLDKTFDIIDITQEEYNKIIIENKKIIFNYTKNKYINIDNIIYLDTIFNCLVKFNKCHDNNYGNAYNDYLIDYIIEENIELKLKIIPNNNKFDNNLILYKNEIRYLTSDILNIKQELIDIIKNNNYNEIRYLTSDILNIKQELIDIKKNNNENKYLINTLLNFKQDFINKNNNILINLEKQNKNLNLEIYNLKKDKINIKQDIFKLKINNYLILIIIIVFNYFYFNYLLCNY